MNAQRDPDRLINAFLLEGQTELSDQVYDAVRASIEQKRQRVVIGPWRLPTKNKFAPIGLGIAAVVVVLVVGTQLLGPPAPGGVGGAPSAEPSPTAEPSAAAPSSPANAGLAKGPFTIVDEGSKNSPVRTTVTIPASGWTYDARFGLIEKGEQADPPEAAVLAWSWPAGTGFYVYGDPCHWASTTPNAPVTKVDALAAALAAQPSRDASDPVDVTIGGYVGKQITLHVPDDAPTRAEAFKDCDDDTFASYGTGNADSERSRTHQGPGQIDELWILDVNGAIVIIDAMYRPTTPAELIEEMRAIAESATFE